MRDDSDAIVGSKVSKISADRDTLYHMCQKSSYLSATIESCWTVSNFTGLNTTTLSLSKPMRAAG